MRQLEIALGLMLSDEDYLAQCVESFPTNPFHDAHLASVYAQIKRYYDKGQRITAKDLIGYLKDDKRLIDAGGAMPIIELEMNGRGADAVHYFNILKEHYRAHCVERIADVLRQKDECKQDQLDAIAEIAHQGASAGVPSDPTDLSEVANNIYNDMDYLSWVEHNRQAFQRGEIPLHGPSTGMREIDEITGGLVAGNLVLVGARPAMGKSEWLLHCVMNCIKSNVKVAMYSLEMSPSEIMERLVGMLAGVNYSFIRKGDINTTQFEAIKQAQQQLKAVSSNFILRGGKEFTGPHLHADARSLKRREGIQVVFVDHIGILADPNPRASKYENTSRNSREMKLMARSLKLPVWCATQLNREVAKGMTRPTMAHLRDSGSLEQDADYVFLLHRRDYYDPNDHPGTLEVICDKARNGTKKTIRYRFDYPRQRYSVLQSFDAEQQMSEKMNDYIP